MNTLASFIMNKVYMRIVVILIFLSVTAIPFQSARAQQQYPVQIQPTVSFPSVFINDYADPATTTIRVYLADLTKQNYRINIRIKITGLTSNVLYQNLEGINLTMDGGEVYFLNDQELAKLFSTTNLTTNAALTTSQYSNTLNEGVYTLSLEAFDASLLPALVPVSNSRTDFTTFNVVRYDPPLLNGPENGHAFDIQTINQNIFFNWTPRHVIFSPKQQVKYRFRMINVIPVDRNPYDAMKVAVATKTGNIDVSDLDFPTFIYSPTDLPLEQGAVYAWQVQAYEVVNGIEKATSRFKNEGYSEVYTFSIKENCEPVTIYPVLNTGDEVTLSWSGSDAVSDYSEFEVNYRPEATSLPWTPVLTGATSITLNNTTLRTDLTYEYTVKPKCKNWQTPGYGGTFKLNAPTCVAPAPIQVASSGGGHILSWPASNSATTLRLSYKLKDAADPFTTVDLAGTATTYTLPAITQGGYTIHVDAVCGTETATGQTNSFDYNETGVVGPCPIPMPFQLSAERIKSDTATLNWTNIPSAHTGYSITYWHKDSIAKPHTISSLIAPTTQANLLFDNQLYSYKITYLCGTKSATTDIGMFRMDGGAGTIPVDPKTADCFPPVDLRGQVRSTTSALIEWNKISGADEYQLFYGVKGTKPFMPFTTTGTSTTLKNLVASAKYQFIVRVRCGGMYSIFSDTALVDLGSNAGGNCDTVRFVTSMNKTNNNILLAWEYDANYTGYMVTYRETAQGPSNSYTQAFTNMDTVRINYMQRDTVRFTFQNLKAGTEYVFMVQAVCGSKNAYINAPYKASTLPDAATTGGCGSANACDKTDKSPLTMLNIAEKFNCADYEVTVDKIDNPASSTGKYTGTGHMNMPVAGLGDFVTMSISFKDITINENARCVIDGIINVDSMNAGLLPTELRQQISGYMDQVTNAIAQANDLLTQASDGLSEAQKGVQQGTDYFQGGEGVGSVVTGELGEKSVKGTVPAATTTATVSGNSITMPGAAESVTVTAFPALLKDDAKNVFQVTATGAVTHIGKYDETFAEDPIVVDVSSKKVVFTENETAIYDFDAWDAKYSGVLQIEREYEKIGAGYYVPAKFIIPGALDVVNAAISGSSANAENVRFANGKGLVYKHTTTGSTFTIKLAGGPGSDAQEIYAWYVNGASKTAIGKLLLPSYTSQVKDVVIIPVDLIKNTRQTISPAVYETYLNKTYGRIGITYRVTVDDSFRSNLIWDANGDKSVQASGSRLLSNDYQGEEEAMIQAYVTSKGVSGIHANTAYFLAPYEVSRMENRLLGKMPPEEQFGFIYTGGTTEAGVARTLAHELGHGAYHLEHIFNSIYLGVGTDSIYVKSSLNLMSYYNSSDANQLWKFQWDAVQAPGHVWGILNKDKNTQAKDKVKDFCKIINALNQGSSADDRRNALSSAESLANENNIKIPYFRNINNSESELFNSTNASTNNLKYFMYKLYCNGININLSYIKSLDFNTDAYKTNTTDEGYTLKCQDADYTIWFRNTDVKPFLLGGFQVVDKSGNINYELSGIGQGAIDSYPNDRIKGVLCAIYSVFNNVALSKDITIDIPVSYKNCYTGRPHEYGPMVSLSISPSLITEDNGVASVTATLSKTSETDIKVFLSFRNTALIDVDYTADRFIIIPAGQLEASIPVTAIRDATQESDEFIETDIQKIEGGATDALKGPFVITIKESPHPTLAVVTNVHTYVDQIGNVKIMWSSDGSINKLKWRKNSSTTEISIPVTCSGGNCFAIISGIKKTDLVNYNISTSNPGDPGFDAISSVTNGFQGENCIECLCDGELYTIGNKTVDLSGYTVEWRNSSGAVVSEFNGKTMLSSFEFKLSGINTYIIKRINAAGIYDEAEVLIKPVLNCTWFLQAKDLTVNSGGPRVAKTGQTLQLVEKTPNTTGTDAIVEIVEGTTKNAYVKGDPKWERDAVLISNQTSIKKNDPVIHNQFDPGNQIINPEAGAAPENDKYEVSALNRTEAVDVEYFCENKVKVSDPLAIPELQVYHNTSDICVQMEKVVKYIDTQIDQYCNDPINNNVIDPINTVITKANPVIASGNTVLPANAQIPPIPLIPHIDFKFPIGCNITNEIYDLNAEKESDPRVVRDTYGKYNINLTGSGTIPVIDLTITTNPVFINYDRNLRKTPDSPASVSLTAGQQSGEFNRAIPNASPVQVNIQVKVMLDFKSPCIKNPDPCLIEVIFSGSVNFSLVSNSPFVPQALLPPLPALPSFPLGSIVLINK